MMLISGHWCWMILLVIGVIEARFDADSDLKTRIRESIITDCQQKLICAISNNATISSLIMDQTFTRALPGTLLIILYCRKPLMSLVLFKWIVPDTSVLAVIWYLACWRCSFCHILPTIIFFLLKNCHNQSPKSKFQVQVKSSSLKSKSNLDS